MKVDHAPRPHPPTHTNHVHQGFAWVNDATEERAKFGFNANASGAELTMRVDPAAFLHPDVVRAEEKYQGEG